MKADHFLDATGLSCPMPIVKTRNAMKEVNSGEVLEVKTTDKGAKADLTAWTKSGGHELLEQLEENDVYTFFIKKG
ncbi:sulfurtransferase TusA family protein [Sporosarcina gallistercoris]|uniref:Sulfurtransferase TusA family protein n=1 Tax=Sporosarcina gallistercoris TaxID=2762245 RepID=A0ABR8PMG7_9BACL|nr:sulfurtransferase TusA family protein [Sporosarcina gallistercoris]MBD7909357.1 sulfurtransferase TusA family protein [Sporosarcina gallistercoris]